MNREKLGKLRDMIQFLEIGIVSPISKLSNIVYFKFMNNPG